MKQAGIYRENEQIVEQTAAKLSFRQPGDHHGLQLVALCHVSFHQLSQILYLWRVPKDAHHADHGTDRDGHEGG